MQPLWRRIAIGFWTKCAILRRSGGVSNSKSNNLTLAEDIRCFYEKEVFPYCTDREALQMRLEQNKAVGMENALLHRQWERGSLSDKFLLMVKKPIWSMKRTVHMVSRV